MANAILFLREGTDKSVEEQQALCASVAAENGLAVTETRIYTGKKLRGRQSGSWALSRRGQPELTAAITAINRGDRLVVVNPDCLDTEPLAAVSIDYAVRAGGGGLLFADPAHPSVYAFRGASSVLEQHHRTVKALTKTPTSRTPLPGERVWMGGAVPFGYKLAGEGQPFLVPVREEQKVIDRMAELKNEGLSLRKISAALASEGHFPPRGGDRWQPNSIGRALKRRARDAKELAKNEKKKKASSS